MSDAVTTTPTTAGDRLAAARDPVEGHALARAAEGARTVFRSLSFVARHPRVGRWLLLCMAAYTAVWVAVMWEAAAWQARFLDAVLGVKGTAWWQAALWEIGRALALLGWWLFAIVSVFAIAGPLLSPLFGMLAEAVETAFYGSEPAPLPWPQRLREMAHGVGRAAILGGLQIGGSLLIAGAGFVAGLIFPPLGTLIGTVLGGGWSALWFAMIAMSHTLENHYVGVGRQLALAPRFTATLLGFGLAGQLFAWLPFAAPVLVVAGALLTCRLQTHGHIELPLRKQQQDRPSP